MNTQSLKMLSNPPVIVSGKQLTLLLQIESKFLQLVYSILQKTSPGGMYAIYIWHDLKSHFVFVLVHGPIQVLDDGYGWKPSGRRRLVAKVKLSQRVITKVKLVSFFVYGLGVEVFVLSLWRVLILVSHLFSFQRVARTLKETVPVGPNTRNKRHV